MPAPTIRMYATATCPYCIRAEALLRSRGVDTIDKIRIDLEPGRKQAMIEESGRTTVPQIFIDGKHIGGCDDLLALDRAGGLMPLLSPSGA